MVKDSSLSFHPKYLYLTTQQAPKTLPPIAKQNLILSYIQQSLTVHNIKELEKSLPGVASISSMQVKDYLQALSDEGKIRVEKIGSGNWYWSFMSEEKASRDNIILSLEGEKEKVCAAVQSLKKQVDAATAMRGADEERDALAKSNLSLHEELLALRKELESYKDGDPGEVKRRMAEIEGFKAHAEKWTDNIGILEGRLKEMLGGDEEHLSAMQRELYGNEYVEGEGLHEL